MTEESAKLNCWEIKQCGRESGGSRSDELGVCPAAEDVSSNGINGGVNAGRICWAVAGTFCGGKIQGAFAQKLVSCMSCEAFKQIKAEEGPENFTLLKPGQAYRSSPR